MRIAIDRGRCIGCGRCAEACAEGVISMDGGKARVARGDLCDGMGACLPSCPSGALSLEADAAPASLPMVAAGDAAVAHESGVMAPGMGQWPIQIRLVPPSAPFVRGRDAVVIADCAAFSCDRSAICPPGSTVLLGCPKLDPDQTERLASIFSAGVRHVSVVRMNVPCCRALERMAADAMGMAGMPSRPECMVASRDGSLRPAKTV